MSGVGATVIAIDEAAGESLQGLLELSPVVLPENARSFYLQPLWSREALWQAQTTSELNGPMTFRAPVWRVALDSLMRGTTSTNAWKRSKVSDLCAAFGVEPDAVEWVQPSRKDEAPKRVYAGDRPKGRVNGAGDIEPYPRDVQSIDALAIALWRREDAVEGELSRANPRPALAVRRTHRAIHEALTSEDTSQCRWCCDG